MLTRNLKPGFFNKLGVIYLQNLVINKFQNLKSTPLTFNISKSFLLCGL